MKHILPLLSVVLILGACSPQVTVASEVTVTLPPPPTETPLPTLTPTPIAVDGIAEDAKGNKLAYLDGEWLTLPDLEGDYKLVADADGVRALDENGAVKYTLDMAAGEWVEVAQSYTLDDLVKMDDDAKLSLAPTLDEARERIPSGVSWTIESQEVFGERAVVYYDETGRQRAVYDLLTSEMYDGVSLYDYDKDKSTPPLTAYFFNDSEALKEIPEKYLIKGQEERLGEAIFAVLAINWAYPQLINVDMLENNAKYGLGKVEAQWEYYNEIIKPAFIAALEDGTVWTEGKKGIPVEGEKIVNELPTFVVVRGRDDGVSFKSSGSPYHWVTTRYLADYNTYEIVFFPSDRMYREIAPIMIGGDFANMRGLVTDDISTANGASRDFAKVISLILTGKTRVSVVMKDPVYGDSEVDKSL